MPYKHILNEITGWSSTTIAVLSTIVANFPNIESVLRMGVSVAGIGMTMIAARYWWFKGTNAREERKHHRTKRKEDDENNR